MISSLPARAIPLFRRMTSASPSGRVILGPSITGKYRPGSAKAQDAKHAIRASSVTRMVGVRVGG